MAGVHILLVEDNPDDEELTLLSLRKHGLASDIVIARDGVEALDYLFGEGRYAGRDVSIVPTVVLLDLKLPRLDGLGVLKRIRDDARTRYVPVVVLTSSSQDADIVTSYQLGANSYIRKPVEFGELTDTVSKVGLYWMNLNWPPAGGGTGGKRPRRQTGGIGRKPMVFFCFFLCQFKERSSKKP